LPSNTSSTRAKPPSNEALADAADDRRREVLVLLLAPRGLEGLLAEALLVERELELPEILPGEVAGPPGDDDETRGAPGGRRRAGARASAC